MATRQRFRRASGFVLTDKPEAGCPQIADVNGPYRKLRSKASEVSTRLVAILWL